MRATGVIRAACLTIIGPPRSPGFAAWQPPAGSTLPLYGYQLCSVYPHDPKAFTQGLQYLDGFLYEGTGLNGRSSIRKVKLETGEVLQTARRARHRISARASPSGRPI